MIDFSIWYGWNFLKCSWVSQMAHLRAPRWRFEGCGIRPFLFAGYGIGFKIVAGYGIQISAGCGIGHEIIAGFGIQISRGNVIRSDNCSGCGEWSIFTLAGLVKPWCNGNRNSRIDSEKYKEIAPLDMKR